MYLNNKGWCLKEMILLSCVILVAVFVAAIMINNLYKDLDMNINGNNTSNTSNSSQNKDEKYATIERNLLSAARKYARENEKAWNKNIRFTITTNATLLDDEMMEYMDENFENIILSLDGRKEVNDKVRIKPDGSGCYDDILPKIKKMVEKRNKNKAHTVRGTFTRENLDFYEDVKMMVEEGFKQISIEPVVLEDGHPLSLREEDLPTIFESYDKLYEDLLRRQKNGEELNFYHFNINLNGGPCVYKRISGCGAGFEYVAITPQGDVYPCHQFVGKEEYKLGSIYDDSYDEELGKKFKMSHIYNKPKCKNCWARFYCSGGCQANNITFNGDMKIPYEVGCKMQQKRIECAIALKAQQ